MTKDRIFINSDGKRNFPSGELFTSPVEDSANGIVQFDIPATYGNRVIEGVRLVFRNGRVVEASARQGESFLLQMLDLDAGSRYLGEFAFGNNQRVNRATRNILFDEKIGGTVHMALGAGYPRLEVSINQRLTGIRSAIYVLVARCGSMILNS